MNKYAVFTITTENNLSFKEYLKKISDAFGEKVLVNKHFFEIQN